jgi:hypothetical protein
LGRKHIYLPHAQTAIYESKVKLFLKQGISHQLGRDAVVIVLPTFADHDVVNLHDQDEDAVKNS